MRSTAAKLTLAAVLLSVAAAGFLLLYPTYSGLNNGRPTRATLVEVNGPWVVIPVLLPIALCALPLLFPYRPLRIVIAILLPVFCLVAMSIGLFYFPSAILMVLAAVA